MLFPNSRGRAGRASTAPRRRPSRFIPSCSESLERRTLMTAGGLGLNVDISRYASFVNWLQTPGDWGPAPGKTDALVYNASGDPESDAALLFDLRVNQSFNGPDPNAVTPDLSGTYSLSFTGQATIEVAEPGNSTPFTVQDQVYNASTNTTTASIVVASGNTNDFFDIAFLNTQATPTSALNTGFSNASLIRPGYAAGSTQLYTDQFLAALEPYSVLRYLNVDRANYQPFFNGNTLVTVGASQVDQTGLPWEYLIALANETNTDIWINVPQGATDDYVTALADIFKNGGTVDGVTYAGLNPNLKVYLEYSNEVWGGIQANEWYQEAAVESTASNDPLATFPGNADVYTNPDGSTTTAVYTAASRRYLERTYEISQIFQSVLGADPAHQEIRPVLGWQEGNFSFYPQAFAWFEHFFGSVSAAFYGMGDANYLTPAPSSFSSVNSVISSLTAVEQSYSIRDTTGMTALATYFGLANVSYEGGPAIIGTSTSTDPIALAASRDPRMEQIIYQHYIDAYEDGSTLSTFFDGPFGTWTPQNEWDEAELAQINNPTAAAKYRGTLDVANASPVAVTAGYRVATGQTTLNTQSDTLGGSFATPSTGQQDYWLLNLAAGGTYNLTLTTGASVGTSPGQIEVFLDNNQLGGVYSVSPSGTINLGQLTLAQGLSTLSIYVVHGSNDPGGTTTYQFKPTGLTLTSTLDSAGLAAEDTSTQGTWSPTYGVDGYEVVGGNSSLPAYATVTTSGNSITTWASSTNDSRAPMVAPGATSRDASAWSGGSFTINVDLNDGLAHDVSLYFLDWDSTARSEQVQVVSASTGAILDTETVSSFHNGEYLTWSVTGDVVFDVTQLTGAGAVVSGVFFGNPTDATFVGSDPTTSGTWSPNYGADGYDVIGGNSSLPAYATVTASGASNVTWAASTTSTQAPQVSPGSTSRVAAAWYSSGSFTVNVNLTDGQSHDVSLYFLDWDSTTRTEQVQVVSAATGEVLDTEIASGFHNGKFLTWRLTGDVQFVITRLGGANAVVSGIFFQPPVSGSAKLAGTDTSTEGNWSPNYGVDGYDVIGGTSDLPAYATVASSGASNVTWAASSTDGRAPQVAPGSASRVAATWYSFTSFTINVNLNDNQTHDVSLYFLDWDSTGRSEQVQVINAATGAILDTETVSSFHNGEYLTWQVTGSVQFVITHLAGANAVVSGIFFGTPNSIPSGQPGTPTIAKFAGSDTTTQGNWSPTYGNGAYDVMGATSSLPSNVSITQSGASNVTWASSTPDVRAPQVAPGATSRVAAAWYSSSSFTVNVNLNDGQSHDVSLYFLDWDSTGRSEQVQVISVATGAVIDTETASSFHNGVYLTWQVTGNVKFVITRLAGANAVLSGVFIGSGTNK